jgi:CheY-like chemotaxis protein
VSKKILIIEDDRDILISVQELLETEGYIAEIAPNGAQALKMLREASVLPQLILLDYMMPVMDGPTFRNEQRQDPRLAAIPIILMTADSFSVQKQREIGAVALLKKPLDVDVFLEKLSGYFSEPVPLD